MTKKLRDITIGELVEACNDHPICKDCPMYWHCPSKRFDSLASMEKDLEKEVDL